MSKPTKKTPASLQNLDIFGERVSLKFNGNNSYQTTSGGCISIVYFLFAFLLLSLYIKTVVVGYEPGRLFTTDGMVWSYNDM